MQWVAFQEGNPELQELESFIRGSKHACPVSQEGSTASIFPDYLLYEHPYKQSRTKVVSVCACKMFRNIDPWRTMPSATQLPETVNIISASLMSEKRALGAEKSGKAARL